MHTPIGKTVWAFADLFWPKVDNGQDYVSHEAICVLNLSDQTAHIDLTFYFEDRLPCQADQPYPLRPAQRRKWRVASQGCRLCCSFGIRYPLGGTIYPRGHNPTRIGPNDHGWLWMLSNG